LGDIDALALRRLRQPLDLVFVEEDSCSLHSVSMHPVYTSVKC
jgi:hypothetical protein